MRSNWLMAEQGRVIFALLMREMATRYGSSPGGYVWAILEPLGVIVMLSAAFTAVAHEPPLGESFVLYFTTGYVAFHVYGDISSSVSSSVDVNLPLFNFPKVTLIDAVLARFMLQMLTSVFAGAVILAGVLLVEAEVLRVDPAPIVLAVGLAALLGLGVGALNCVLFAYSMGWRRVFGILNRPLFLISGVFFTYESMSPPVQELLWWNPLIHMVTLMRAGFYPEASTDFVSVLYVVQCGLWPLMFGILLLRVLRSRIVNL